MNLYNQIIASVNQADRIVITAHKSPDGDSIGSSMALYHWLKDKGKNVSVCHPDAHPNFLSWVPSVDEINHFEISSELIRDNVNKADIIFALDYNHPSRLGKEMETLLTGKKEKTIMIDHHLDPSDFAFIALSQPEVCSTAQLIYELIQEDKETRISVESGTCIYLGIMTDTGSFRFNSVAPRTHEILAHLLSIGVDHTAIHEAVFGQNSLNQLRLRSYAICNNLELIENGKVALMWLSASELEQYHYEKGDTEGLVNVALSVTGVKLAVFMVEKEGKIKMSFRAKENQTVNAFAVDYFEGGGHAYAAGGISSLSLGETIKKVKDNIAPYIV
jgi:bifunctional oligoribonuclease and PAP phosphatase NrnA